jgi:hypothetical protein
MLRWTRLIIALLFGICTSTVHSDTIRGVNLGGWLLVEEWYAAIPDELKLVPMLTIQDYTFAVPQHEC